MSPRRYSRLSKRGKTAILMDADQDMTSFVEMTAWLSALSLSVPNIIAEFRMDGLVLLEDFGNTSVKTAIQNDPTLQDDAFEYCLDALLHIRHAVPPSLSCPSAQDLVAWTDLVDTHLPNVDSRGLYPFREVLERALTEILTSTPTTSLRDFHSENMMWLPDRDTYRKLGLLDYQDAFLTHYAYDLVSLLTDARTWIPRPLREETIERYLARTGDTRSEFSLAFSALSAQRNLRILGIFARAGRFGPYMRNTFRYFVEALEHPVFSSVREQTLQALPSELGDA